MEPGLNMVWLISPPKINIDKILAEKTQPSKNLIDDASRDPFRKTGLAKTPSYIDLAFSSFRGFL